MMTEEQRWSITPQQYIRKLFAETKDGKVAFTVFPELEEPYEYTCEANWSEADAEGLVQKYETLAAMLYKFGKMAEELEEEENREKLLTPEELEVWNTYILSFDYSEWDMENIIELQERLEYDELSEEEYDILERYDEWRTKECDKRLPKRYFSSEYLINRARRYVRLVYLDAPLVVQNEELRYLAEKMVLYYCCK